MKALVTLRKKLLFLKRQVGSYGYNNDTDYKNVVDKEIIEVEESIVEIEELVKKVEASKAYFDLKLDGTCNDCKHLDNDILCGSCIHQFHIQNYKNNWESK